MELENAEPGGGALSIDGFLRNETDQLDFAINDETGEAGALTLSVSHGPHSVAVSGTVTEGELDGLISLDGEAWATMTGDPDNLTFNSADGDGFTAQELSMLQEVGMMAERVFAFFGELMEPAMHIILLGLVL